MKEPTITILRIVPGKSSETVSIPNTLESLQSEVGGMIEAFIHSPRRYACSAMEKQS